ncbi:MAG: DUF192 domain-containing protein [Desulfomonilaceae bacterium]
MLKNLPLPHSLCLVSVVALLFAAVSSSAQSSSNIDGHTVKALSHPTVPITLGSRIITATLANTDATRIEGLLGWTQIGEDQGMLLDFIRPGVFAIHMQGMKFPIDALWIDSNGIIKLIYSQIQPNSGIVYPSLFEVRYCLEIAPGFCRKYGIKEGQKVKLGN